MHLSQETSGRQRPCNDIQSPLYYKQSYPKETEIELFRCDSCEVHSTNSCNVVSYQVKEHENNKTVGAGVHCFDATCNM